VRALALLFLAAALQPCYAQDVAAPDTQTAPAPQPAAALTGLYRIAGTVVSAADGHPLQRADVRITNGTQQTQAQSTTADEYGRFAFTGVPAGTFVLQGDAPGFVTGFYDQHGAFNTGIVTGAGVDTESLVLKLQPQGTISLIVTDESGEPVTGASVRLYRRNTDLGEEHMVTVNNGNTDDLGRFQSRALAPGTFFITVQATPWYAVHAQPPPREGQPQQPVGFVDSIQSGLDVAYPITYYPGSTDAKHASAISIRGGETLELALQLHAEPAFSITVPAPEGAGTARGQVRMPQIATTVFGEPVFFQSLQQNFVNGSVTVSGLPPGDYTLRESTGPMNLNAPGTTVHVTDHSLTVQPPSTAETAHLTVEARAVDGSSLKRPFQVNLLRGRVVLTRQLIDDKGVASFDVAPGDYSLSVAGGGRPFFVGQVFVHDQALASDLLHLTAGSQTSCILSLVAGMHTVRGIAKLDGKPAGGMFVMLVPTAQLGSLHMVFRDQSNLDGSFELRPVPPGDYTLFVIQNGWGLDWQQKATFDRYLPHATTVHVADTATQLQTLPEPIPAQPR
jgi:hypothetical protein